MHPGTDHDAPTTSEAVSVQASAAKPTIWSAPSHRPKSMESESASAAVPVITRAKAPLRISFGGVGTSAGIIAAKRWRAITIALKGPAERLGEVADYVLVVPSQDTASIQEAHVTHGHILCHLVEVTWGRTRARDRVLRIDRVLRP